MRDNADKYPAIDLVATGENIKKLRLERQIKVKELKEYLGFDEPQAIYKWERGESIPSTDNLVALAHYYGIKVDDIIVRNFVPKHSNSVRNETLTKLDEIDLTDKSGQDI